MPRRTVEDFESDTESESPFNACNPFRIIRDKWTRKYRNPRQKGYVLTVRFPLNSLPQELKSAIFHSIDVKESLQLLKVCKNSRNQILINGPFHRKIDEICLNFLGSFSESETQKQSFQIRIYQRNRFYHDLQIDDVWKFGYAVRTIKNCKILSVNRESRNAEIFPETFPRLRFTLKKLNPFANLQNISNFNIGADFELAQLFFTYFSPKSIHETMLNLKWKDEEKDELQIFLLSLMENQAIRLSRNFFWRGDIHFLFEIFKNLNTKMFLNLYAGNEHERFVRNLRFYLENGIPSGNEGAILGARAILSEPQMLSQSLGQVFGEMRNIIGNYQEIEIVDENSVISKNFFESLSKCDDFYKILIEQRSQPDSVRALFRKQALNKKTCLYLLTVYRMSHSFWEYFDIQFFMKYV